MGFNSGFKGLTLNHDARNHVLKKKRYAFTSPISVTTRPIACWDCGFESGWRFWCLSLVSVACCQVEVSTSGWSFVQRTPTECGVSSGSDREARRGRPWPGIGWSATKRRYIANSSHVRMFIFVGVLYEVITWNALCRDHFRLSVHVSVCPSVTYQRLYRLWNFHGRAFILSIISLTQQAGRCLSVFRVVLTPVSRRYHELNAKVIHLTQCVLHCGLHKYTVNWEMFRTDRSIVNTEDVKEERKEWWRWEGQIKGIGKRSTNIYIKWSDMLNY